MAQPQPRRAHPELPRDRAVPHSLEAERAVLSACLRSQDALGQAAENLKVEDFYAPKHQAVYEALQSLMQRGEPPDAVTVADELEKLGRLAELGGPGLIQELLEVGSSLANVAYHARIVAERSRLRQLIAIGQQVAADAMDAGAPAGDLLDAAQNDLFQLSQDSESRGYVALKDLASSTFKQIQEAYDREDKLTGIATGFDRLDNLTGGLQRSDLVIVAGRPAMGKTSFALNLAYNAAHRYRTPVGVFSLEMSSEQLCMRLISSQGRLDNHAVRTGRLRHTDWPRLTQALSELTNTPIYIDDTSSISLLELRSKARRMVQLHGVKMIIIDYLQLVTGGARAENRQQEISLISRSLKGLAKDLNVPIVALSQLSRAVESRTGNRPMLSDLRESGAIEQDADIVMFVYRQEVYEPDNPDVQNVAEIILGKHRNGPIGTVKLFFDKKYTQFTNLAADHPAYHQGEG